MPFGLCNAPATFHLCMMLIFFYKVKNTIDTFIHYYYVVGESLDRCFDHLDEVLKWYDEYNLVLNWEKCHFMVKQGTILCHRIFKRVLRLIERNSRK